VRIVTIDNEGMRVKIYENGKLVKDSRKNMHKKEERLNVGDIVELTKYSQVRDKEKNELLMKLIRNTDDFCLLRTIIKEEGLCSDDLLYEIKYIDEDLDIAVTVSPLGKLPNGTYKYYYIQPCENLKKYKDA